VSAAGVRRLPRGPDGSSILGSEWLHPAVLKAWAYDPDRVNRFALGCGLESVRNAAIRNPGRAHVTSRTTALPGEIIVKLTAVPGSPSGRVPCPTHDEIARRLTAAGSPSTRSCDGVTTTRRGSGLAIDVQPHGSGQSSSLCKVRAQETGLRR